MEPKLPSDDRRKARVRPFKEADLVEDGVGVGVKEELPRDDSKNGK